jgi:hypothetical protein
MNNIEYIAPPQITLTEEQQKVYDELIKFVKSDKEKQIMLVSAAGTGKTSLVSKFINDLTKNKICRRIAVCSPTHKALNILKNKLFSMNDNPTLSQNVDVMTIHRLLNYQKNIDSSGEVYYGKGGGSEPNLSIYDLILIDEVSMLATSIINDIENELNKDKNKKLKILLCGDNGQLNPVGEPISLIFTKKIRTLTLEKIIRTKSHNIMQLSNAHRKWIMSNNDKDMPCLADYEDERIILHSSENVTKWLDKFVNLLKTQGKDKNGKDGKDIPSPDNLENNIILTWTNKKCNKYNDYVRKKMFNKKQLDKYELGEILIFNDFHRILMNKANDKGENKCEDINLEEAIPGQKLVSFYTSEQIKLTGIKQDKFQFERIKNLKSTDLPVEIADKFVKILSGINKTLCNTTLDVYYMEVQKMSELKNEQVPTYKLLSIHHNSEVDYNKLKEYFEEQMVKLKNSCHKMVDELKTPKNTDNSSFNMVKLEYINIIDKKINRIWKDWQAQVIDRFAQLNYGYAITVHKSQGSTFMNVFIDIMDIFENHNQPERLKCLYTAITRSSHSLELLI